MKKLLIISALALSCCSTFIPTTSYAQAMADKKMKDGTIKMVNGKMMVAKGGSWVAMTQNMTMPNGTQVMTDGNIMKKGGKKEMLKNGDCVKPDGMIDKKM